METATKKAAVARESVLEKINASLEVGRQPNLDPESRKVLVASLEPPLKKIYQEHMRRVKGNHDEQLRYYWELGRDCSKYKDEKHLASQERFSLAKLALAMGADSGYIYKATAFYAKLPTRSELDRFVRVCAGKIKVSSYLHIMVGVKSTKALFALAAKIVADDLRPKEVLDLVQQNNGGNQRKGSGRKLAVPKSVLHGLDDIVRVVTPINNKTGEVWFGDKFDMVKELLNSAAEMPQDEFFKRVDAAEQAMEGLSSNAAFCLENFKKMKREYLRLHKEAKSDEELPEASNGHAGNGHAGKGRTTASIRRAASRQAVAGAA